MFRKHTIGENIFSVAIGFIIGAGLSILQVHLQTPLPYHETYENLWEPVVLSNFDYAIGETELPIDEVDEIVIEEQDIPKMFEPYIGQSVGDKLTSRSGLYYGPSGLESYYNLDMSRCIEIMRELEYNDIDFPYWIREDGAKMLGEYVMVAANLEMRPKGTILETSLGMGIVVDTGEFARTNPTQIDIATDW